jgi:hypothetical protein
MPTSAQKEKKTRLSLAMSLREENKIEFSHEFEVKRQIGLGV